MVMEAVTFDRRIAAPTATPVVREGSRKSAEAIAPVSIPVTRCEVPLLRNECNDWPEGTWGGISVTKSAAIMSSIAWITERLSLPPMLQEWSSLSHEAGLEKWASGASPCEACAPSPPKLEWVSMGRGKIVALEDPVQAGAYEQRLKRRPPAFSVERRVDPLAKASKAAEVNGQIRISINPMALALRALGSLTPSGQAMEATIEWRIVPHSDLKTELPKLTLSSNKHDPAAEQPPHFSKFAGRPSGYKVLPLRIEQQRSLHWMLAQEAEDADPFMEVEVAEGVLPALRWRLESRATVPHVVRGGVLADEVGYGKTVITIALIDSTPREPRIPPPPLRADGFLQTKATLVLAPSHLLKQWPREVQKFAGGALKCCTIATMADINKLTIKEIQQYDVIVCSITLLRSDLYFARLANWRADTLPASKTTNQRHFGSAYRRRWIGLRTR